MNLQEARKRIPELDGLSDESALSVIQQVYYPDMDRTALAGRLGVKLAATPAPERTWGQALGDTAVQLAEGVNTTLGAVPSIVAPEGAMAGFFRGNAEHWRDKQSDVLKERIAGTDQRIQEAGKDGVMSQIGTAVSEYWNDPAQAARLVATNLPSMAATLGTGAAAGIAAKGVAAARGMDAAGKAALAAKYGTTTAAATNAALNAGGARGEAFEDLQQTALAQGMSPEQAEQAGVSGSILPGVVGGVAGAISGKMGLEKALLGQATTGAATRKAAGAFGAELAGEQIEELAPKVTTNYQVGQLEADRGLTDDLGRTIVETAIGSGPGAVVAGGAAVMRTPAQEAADAIRATETLPESGPMTRATNAATEAKAQAIEAGAPLLDEQAAAEPVPEPVDDPVRDQILALPDGARQDALRAYVVVNRTDVAKGVKQYNRKLLDRLLAENTPPPVLGERLTDTDMGAMLGGGGMAGNADPLMGALGMNREAQANSITNVARAAQNRPPMPASDAVRMLDEARNQGVDLVAAEHPAGGFVLVPPPWVTPEVAAQGEQRLNETIARMQQADAAPVERAPRNRISPVELNLPTDPVQNYVGNLRTVNTPAARAFVRDFDAGRVTPADVQQRITAEQGKTPDQRIAQAAAEAPAQADPVADRLRQAVSQAATAAPTDILNPAGLPFKTKMAADRAAKKTPGAVVPVEGGFVVRPQEQQVVQDVPQAPEVPQAAPAISQPGQAPQAVGAQPAGPAAGVPAEGAGAVEAAGVTDAPTMQEGAGPATPTAVAEIPPASATHTDPGQAPEVVTPAVVEQSVQKAARNEAVKPSEMRQWIVGEIDRAMLGAPEKDAAEFVSFDVPGDGTFKVQKSRERLQEFRKKVLASPGFKDGGQKQNTKLPEQEGSALNGSGSTVEAIRNFLGDGDVEGAVEFAKLKGVEFTPVPPQMKMSADGKGKVKHMPASVKSSMPSVAEGLTQVEAEQINQYLTAERPDAVQGVNPRVPPENRTSEVASGKLDDPNENIRRGNEAMDRVISGQKDEPNAMTRPDHGPVSFVWGKVGNPAKGFAGGNGIAKIIAKRTAEGSDGDTVARKMVEVIALGTASPVYGPKGGERFNVSHDGHTAVLSLHRFGNDETWLLTGWDDVESDGATAGNADGTYAPESSGMRSQEGADGGSVPPAAPEAQAETPKLTPAEAKALMSWQDMGQTDGVKTHALTFYESQADKDAGRGRMTLATVSKGERSATAWTADGDDKTFGALSLAKKRAEAMGMAKAVADGFVEAAAAKPPVAAKPAAAVTTSAPISDFGEKIGGARKDTAVKGAKATRSRSEDDRPAWARRFEISQIAKSSKPGEDGRWVVRDTRTTDWLGQPRQMGRDTFATREEAEAAIPLMAVSQKHRVYADRDEKFAIWRTISDTKRVRVVEQSFDSYEDAMRYMAQNAQAIVETNTTFGESDLPRPASAARTGDQRRTRDARDSDFQEVFGFRGVEFGNWNNQVERQELLNDAYDGLLDLAQVMGIPPKAISLDGELALAFGARGHGLSGARAHYERDRVVINLTKMNGAGSLAHEWFHAVDHYFARQDGKASAEWVTHKDGTRSLKASSAAGGDYVSSGARGERSGMRAELRQALAQVMQTIATKAETYVQDTQQTDAFVGRARKDVHDALGKLRAHLSAQLDARHHKRNNQPASADQLAQFDAIAERIVSGELLDTTLQQVTGARAVTSRMRPTMSGMRWTNDALNQISAILKAVRGRIGFDSSGNGELDTLRGYMTRYSQRLKMLADAQTGAEKQRAVPTEFVMNAKELDQGRGQDYWTQPHELAARAFQGYVEDKIAEQGGRSPFLNYAPEGAGILTPWGVKRPYPAGEERARINAAFDKLAQTIKTKETDQGVAMFSQGLLSPAVSGPKPTLDQVQRLVDKLQQVAKNVVPVTVVASPRDVPGLKVPAGTKPSGALIGGQIYLFADNLKSTGDAYVTLFHEIFHLGLQKVIPAQDYAALLKQFASNPLVAKFVRQWKASAEGVEKSATMPSAAYEALATEEAMAMIAEELSANGGIGTRNMPGLAKKMLSWFAQVAEKLGFPANFSNWVRDLTRTDAERFVSDMTRAVLGGPKNMDSTKTKYGTMAAEMTAQDRLRAPEGADQTPNNPDIRFRSASSAAAAAGAAIKSVTATNIKKRAGFKLTDYLGLGLQTLGRRQIVDIYGDLVPLAEYNTLVTQMEADKNEGGAEADKLVTRWAELPDEGKLADLMHEATLAQIDPAADFVDGDDKAQYLMLRRKHNLLSDEAKQVYADTRDAYKAHHAKVRSAIKERIERSELKGPRKAELLKQMDDEFFAAVKGVYFPLARFGQYAVTVKGADGKVESVSRAEGKAEAEALRNNLLSAFPRDKGFTVGRVMLSKDFIADRDAVGRGFMTELYQVLDKQDMDAAQRAELEDTLGQLYLSSLPDLSWAKHGIHRKGTPGFSQDARRAYAQNMFHGARYLAKLRYSDLMQDELTAMQKHVDDWREVEDFDQNSAQRVVDEMNKRHESLMNPKSNPLSTGLTSFGFVFYLGLSPASAMVNLSQTALVAYPIMGAKWGFGKASAALLKASAEATKGKNDITGSLNADERAAYDEAVRAGTIDVTMAHDLAGIAQGEDAGVMWKIRPVMRWASFLFHHAERFNRQVTFVASYRLARDAGADQKSAFEQATKATYDGHFDYGAANRPRVMQGNVARVLLLFKQYGQNMVYTLSRNAYQSIKGTDAEKAEARKVLAGLLTSHAMAAGVLGLPMVTTLLAAASMIGGDEDEPWDAQTALQNMLADAFGQKTAEVLAHGLSRLTPWDISGRVGLDRLIFPDVQEGLEGQRLAESAMAAALGPVAGIGVNVLKGAQHMSEGRFGLGLEAMLPSALRGPVKAIRYANEGVQDKSGISILDEVGPAAVAGQAMGFSPSQARNAQEGKSAVMAHDRALGERRQELLTKAARATMDKDAEARADAMKEIERFNQKNPARRITPLNVMQSVRNRNKRIDQAQDGVYLPKSRRDAMQAGRFALAESE